MLNIAHRGFSGRYPENTMLAFRKAIEEGADGIELDVHLSSDGEVMIIHDEALKRTTGKDGCVSDYTRAELEKISAATESFEPIPSLEEYLDFMAGHKDKVTNIELKTFPVYYRDIEEKTLALVRRFDLEENIIFSSFNQLSVARMKALGAKSPCGILFSGFRVYNQGALLSKSGIEYFHPDFNDLDDKIVSGFKADGVGLNVWTVNEEPDIAKCIDWGVNGIISNYPDRVRKLLQRP